MAERARHHPHRSAGMESALVMLDAWLSSRQDAGRAARPPLAPPEERRQRELLAASAANAHARSRCGSDTEHESLVAADRRAALAALRSAARDQPFALPATAFVSLFGAPGEHGYGRHRCEDAAAAGLAGWRCTCAFRARHTVEVSAAAAADMRVGTLRAAAGAARRGSAFHLAFDGSQQTATLRGVAARGQSTLTSFFRGVAAAAPAHAAAGDNDSRNDRRPGSGSGLGSVVADGGGVREGGAKRPRLLQ